MSPIKTYPSSPSTQIHDTLLFPILLCLIVSEKFATFSLGNFVEQVAMKLGRMNAYGKRQCRSLFWRVRAALKKAVNNGSKRERKFQYDPSSYALNFDDGHCKSSHVGVVADELQSCGGDVCNSAMWVYVLWVKSE